MFYWNAARLIGVLLCCNRRSESHDTVDVLSLKYLLSGSLLKNSAEPYIKFFKEKIKNNIMCVFYYI